jgi:predicted nucleic acid-binding protein
LTGPRIALDSNVLAYYAAVDRGPEDPAKIASIQEVLDDLREHCDCVAPLQAFGELHGVLLKARETREDARTIVTGLQAMFRPLASDRATFENALELATDHKLQFWDALILATAADAGCGLLLSEDMQDGFEWRGVTVVDPFAEQMHPKLARLLG